MIFRGLIDRSGPVRDAEIQAYVDGVLSGARLRQMEHHLAHHPDDAKRVSDYRHLNARLGGLGWSMHEAPLPASFLSASQDLGDALLRQRRVRRTVGRTLASVLVLLSASGMWMLDAGWGTTEPSSKMVAVEGVPSGLTPDAPAEISAGTKTEVMNWLSRRVDAERLAAPDLNSAGFILSGARVVPTPKGPLVQILYRDQSKAPLTLSVSVGDIVQSRTAWDDLTDRQMAVYWRRGALVYSLVGPMQHSDLATLADMVDQQTGLPQSAKPMEAMAQALAAPEKTGVVLVDTKAEDPAVATPAPLPEKSDTPVARDGAIKATPVTVDKSEEPKPL